MLTSTQNYLMKWASNDLSPITLLPPAESIKNRYCCCGYLHHHRCSALLEHLLSIPFQCTICDT